MAGAAIEVAGITAKSGEKSRGYVRLGTRPGGMSLDMPLFVINGVEDGPTLLVDACNHGSEYEGPPSILRLVTELDPRELRGTLIAVPVVNVPAFEEGRRETTIDGLNINRVWPGKPDGTITQQIAFVYFERVVRRADYIVTLHSGGRELQHPPLVAFEDDGTQAGSHSRELALAFGTDLLCRWTPFAGSLVRQAASHGIVTINPEAGGVDRGFPTFWTNVDSLHRGMRNILCRLGMIDGVPTLPAKQTVAHIVADPPESYLRIRNGGLFYAAPLLGKPVKAGTVLGRVTDLFGDEVERVTAPFDGIVVGLHNDALATPGDYATLFGKQEEVVEHGELARSHPQ